MTFEQALLLHARKVTRYIKNDALDVIGTLAVNHAQDAFINEGYTDVQLQPWKEVKRRQSGKGKPRDQTRPILSDTGDLKDSIRYEKAGNSVHIGSDLPYAQPHNEGTTKAGRGNKTTIPQRQFIGKSIELETQIKTKIQKDLKRITKQ
jgi:phage gpG-like protein